MTRNNLINDYLELSNFFSLSHTKINLSECKRTILCHLENKLKEHFLLNYYDIVSNHSPTEWFLKESIQLPEQFKKIYTKEMLEFCLKICYPLLDLFNNKLKEVKSITQLIEIYLDTFWLLCIQIEGIDFGCEALKETKCNCALKCNPEKFKNILILYIIPEYQNNPCISTKIIKAFKLLKPNKVLLIVDYTNICNSSKEYKWEETGAYERYEHSKAIMPNYFYNSSCVDFGKYESKVKPYKIPNRNLLQLLISTWSKEHKLITFGGEESADNPTKNL